MFDTLEQEVITSKEDQIMISTASRLFNEGREEGREEGIEKGMEKGIGKCKEGSRITYVTTKYGITTHFSIDRSFH